MSNVVSAAIVSGELIIGLDDGSIIRAGYVQGPQGLQGPQGPMGATGARGTDGNTIHTVGGTPGNELGRDGDYAIDNTNWRIYGPRSGGTWGSGKDMLPGPLNSEFKGTLINMGGGGGGGGTLEKSEIIIGPDTPNLGDAIAGLKPGQLWFDSDQLALYILVNDKNSQRVWVIVTPADRSAVQDVVNTFAFPSGYGTERVNDGDTVFNPTTNLWYVYNAKKHQWIDLPPGVNELSMQAILLRGPDPMDESFEYDPNDRVNYETDALCYVDEDNHPDFTRIVIPGTDSAGFDWRFMLRAIKSGDQLSLVQIDPGADPDDPDDNFPFRSDYLTVGDLTENSESFSAEVSFVSENPIHLPMFGETVAIRFKAIVNIPGGTGEIFYQEDAPNPDTDPDLELAEGNIWIDSDDNKLYVWNGSSWSEVTACNGDTDVTKEYVDAQDDKLQQEIIKLQEEIAAIAPTTDVGVWKDGATPNPSEGQFVLRLPGGAVTQQYSDPTTNLIVIHKTDARGAIYNFEDVKIGQLIQFLDVLDQHTGTYKITGIDNTDTTFIALDVEWRQGLGGTHVDDEVIIRIFDAPDGGTASEFVLRSGDDMTGAIEIDDATKISKPNHLVNKGYVDDKFLASGVPDYLQPYWKKGATILHWACEQNHSISARDGARLYIDGTLYRVFSSDMDLSLAGGISKEFVYVMPLEMEWHRLDSFFVSKGNSNDNAQIRLLGYCQTEKNGSFASFFKNCKAFAGQGLEYLRYDSAFTLSSMFYGCSSLNGTININAPVATSAASMFKNCTSLNRSITVHLPTCETTDNMFEYCIAMTTNLISLPGCAMISAKSMFAQCNNWQGNISMLDWDLSALHNAEKMFQSCQALNKDISGWKFPSLHEANYMFENCHALDVDLSSWDLRHVKSFQSTFRNCYKLHGDYTNWKDWMCLAETVYYMFDRSSLVAGDVSDWILPFCQDQSYFSGGTLITGTPQYGMNSDGSLNPSCAPSTNFKNLGLHLHGTLRTTNTVLQVSNALKPDGTRFPQSSTITTTYRNYAEIQPGEEFYQLNTSTLYGFMGPGNIAHEPGDYVEWHADSDTSKQGSMDYLVYHKEYNDHRFNDSIWVIKGLDKVIDVSGCTRLTYHMNFNFNNLGDGVDLPYTADVEYDLSNYDCTNLRFALNVFASSVSYGGTGGRWYKLINFSQLQTPQKYKYCNVSSYGLFPPRWTDPQYDGQMWDPKELEGMDWSHLHATTFMFTGHNDEDVDASAIGMRPSSMYNTCYHMTNNWVKNLGDVDVSGTPYMRQVFRSCDFDEDLSQWCVRTVSTHTEFEYLPVAPISRNHLPQWGFCPRNEDDLDKYIH